MASKEKLQAGAKKTGNALFDGMEQRAAGQDKQRELLGQLDTEGGIVPFVMALKDMPRNSMLSGRVSEHILAQWKAFTDATKTKPNGLKGIPANILLEEALREYMENHKLKGEQGKRYQANMK